MQELTLITELILEAGQMLVAEAHRPGGPRGAGSKMPVDTEIERFLNQRLTEAYPDDAIISEETGGEPGRSGRAFVIDPHDGTSDFLRGRRETSVSIGLVDGDRLVLGAVYAPNPCEVIGPEPLLVTWAQGDVLRCNGLPHAPPPSPAGFEPGGVVLVSANISARTLAQNSAKVAPAVARPCSSVATRWALVALGRAEAGWTLYNRLSAWDFAGAQALLQSVGGDLVDGAGEPIRWQNARPTARNQHFFGARSVTLAAEAARRFSPRGR
jgi:ADP-ribosyl-[dinitrogen reductase] hydrolase